MKTENVIARSRGLIEWMHETAKKHPADAEYWLTLSEGAEMMIKQVFSTHLGEDRLAVMDFLDGIEQARKELKQKIKNNG